MRARAALLLALLAPLLALPASPQAAAAPGLEAPHLLQDRGPIRIDGDADFDAAHGVRGGDGSAASPFVIAHWRIQGPEVLVRVANTSQHFVVRNLQLEGTCAPAQDPLACALEAGVHVENVSAASVVHNVVRHMDRAGISVKAARGVEVVENRIEGGGGVPLASGIVVERSSDTQVRGNLVSGVGLALPVQSLDRAGLRSMDSDRTLFQGNEVRGSILGASLLLDRGAVLAGNVFEDNRAGVAAQGYSARLADNAIRNGSHSGILVTLGWLRVEGGELRGNRVGMEVAAPANATLREVRIEGSGEAGLRLRRANATADAREVWWGAASGPNVGGAGPGTGALIAFAEGAAAAQVQWKPFLAQPPAPSAAGPAPGASTVVGQPRPPPQPGQAPDPAPVAVFEGPSLVHVGREVEFSAARSYDPDGGALRYAWELGDGATAAGPRARHAYGATGERVVKLTVTDPDGFASTASVAVRVVREPLGVVLLVQGTAARGQEVQVRAVAGGQPLAAVAYRFTSGGPGSFAGEPGPSNATTMRFEAPGEVLVGVEARAGNETAEAFERVLVLNQPPAARVEAAPARGDPATAFRFTAVASDPDGDALTYRWDLGQGQVAEGPEAARRFAATGTHVVVLTVSDGWSAVQAQATVEVFPAAGAAPARTPLPPLLAPAALALAAAFALATGPRRDRR